MGSCSVGWKSELAYVYIYIYLSITLRNAIITTHVDASRTVSTWPTGDTLDDNCVGYEYYQSLTGSATARLSCVFYVCTSTYCSIRYQGRIEPPEAARGHATHRRHSAECYYV